MNLTTTVFDDNEMKLLNKGINYNLPPIGKNKLTYEVVEAEAAVKSIPDPHLQNEARVLINNKFNTAIKLNNSLPLVSRGQSRYSSEYKTLKRMKTKLIDNNALIVKADKGNTLVIMDTDSYSHKVHDFISNNNINILNSCDISFY